MNNSQQITRTKAEKRQAKSIQFEIDSLTSLLKMPRERLAKDFLSEMNLKNNAYTFIIREGLMDKFVLFCKS